MDHADTGIVEIQIPGSSTAGSIDGVFTDIELAGNQNPDAELTNDIQWQSFKKASALGTFVTMNVALIALVMHVPFWSYIWLLSISNLVRCICILSLIYAWGTGLAVKSSKSKPISHEKASIFVIPCYNECQAEISKTLHSVIQSIGHSLTLLVLIVDGHATGAGNKESTSKICERILGIEYLQYCEFSYSGWKGYDYQVAVASGHMQSSPLIPFMFFTKSENFGKKDSLILIRELVLQFNGGRDRNLGDLGVWFKSSLHIFGFDRIDYIFGTDADTIVSNNAVDVMLERMESNNSLIGLSGNVKVDLEINNPLNYWVAYQVFEYMCTVH